MGVRGMSSKRRVVGSALAAAAGFTVLAATPALAAATSYPNDYFFAAGDQWALTGVTASIQAPAAWCTSTGAGEVVAMVDTGADFGHPDLSGKLRLGAAFTGGGATTDTQPTATDQGSLQDVEGHGTVTTGVIVANTNNGEGIAAVAPDAQAMVMQVRGGDGSIYESDVALAMEYAADHGANVINVSIEPGQLKAGNTNVPDLTIPFAAQYASQKGAAVVLAAGNDAASQAVYPNHSGIALVAGALGPSGEMAWYSNHGSDVSIYAPGGDAPKGSTLTVQNSVVSTDLRSSGYSYALAEGTSLSAPMVSGALALLMEHSGNNAQAAMRAITANAVNRNGLPELDSAAALGVPDSQRCGTAPPPPSGPPPTLGHDPTPTQTSHTTSSTTQITRTTTTHIVTSTGAVQTQSTTSTSTDTATTSPAPGVAAPSGGSDVGKGGRKAPPVITPPSSGGGVPAPLVIGGLVVLVAGGAPLGVMALKAWRGRGLMR